MKINCTKIFFGVSNGLSEGLVARYHEVFYKNIKEIIPENSKPQDWVSVCKNDEEFVSSILANKDSNHCLIA